MEGVPRLYMIGLPAKQCVTDRKPDFASAINYYIRQSYERDPNLYSTDVDMLQGLRQSAMGAVMSAASTVDDCTVLKRYYVQLIRLTEKFPGLLQQSHDDIDKETIEKTTIPLTFTWYRNLGGKANKNVEGSVVDYGNIEYEMRCVLYNVGAAHSRLAAAQDRSPPLECSSEVIEGTESPSTKALKVACTHLQCAAWAFQQLLGSEGNNNEKCDPQKPRVTNRTVLEFAFNVMLAQAQECILEKSMMDGRKPLIIAKVSAMICEYFATAVDAVRRMEQEPNCVSTYRFEKWKSYSEFKCRYYGSVTALFQGQHVQDQLQQMGTRVSFYRRSLNLLNRACILSEQGANTLMALAPKDEDIEDDDYYYYLKSIDRQNRSQNAITKELEMRRDTLSFAMDVAGAKWRAAKSENELIYHEPVVPVSSDDDDTECIGSNMASTTSTNHPQLEKVKGASLVKPIGFGIEDTELLVIVVTNKDSPCESTTTTLFRDLVPAATRHRAEIYQTEKRAMLAELQSLCASADDRLSMFMDTLNLECLEMYKEDVERNNVLELPQQLVNCCASYQALLLQKQQERGDTPFSDDDEDHLDADMARLSSAIQAVDGMLDEIDRLLKTEELGDSEYRRTMGRPYDYSAGRMRELRREASRYREAHAGRARDSWVTLSRAVRERRRRDLELLALPPTELAARLPPAQPTRLAISAEVAASGAVDLSTSMDITTCSAESSDQNDTESDDSNCGRLRQRDSLKRLDRLNMVVGKLQEVKNQRQTLVAQLQGEMDQEDTEAIAIGQDDADVLGELGGTEVDITVAVKKKLDKQYGNLVMYIDQNLTAQMNIVDAVMTAYARAAPERRAYANAMQRRQTVIASLLDAYESFAIANGGISMASDYEPLLPNSGVLPDAVLAERCTKGLEFYQRLVTNVSKLLQRVKGTCQVQTEQRDQIIKQHQQMEVGTQKSDNVSLISVKPEYTLPSVLANIKDYQKSDNLSLISVKPEYALPFVLANNRDYHMQEGMATLISADSSSSESNNPIMLMGADDQWEDSYDVQRISPPIGSEHWIQQQRKTQSHPPLSTYNTSSVGFMDYYHCYRSDCQSSTNANIQTNSVNQHPLVTASMATYALATNSIGSTAGLGSSSLLPSASPYNNSGASTGHSNDVATAALMNALRLTNNNENCQNLPSYNTNNPGSSVGSDSNVFRNIPATVAAYGVGIGSINDTNNINGGVGGYVAAGGYGGFQNSTTMSQLQQYCTHQYQPQISTAATVPHNFVSGIGMARFVVRPQQPPILAELTDFPFSSPSVLSTTGILSAVQQSPVNDTSNMANFVQHSSTQQQIHMYNQQQQQSQLLYKQQQQQSQYSQLYQQQQQFYQQQIYQQQQSLVYSQQQQQQQQQINGTAANFYYSSQFYQPQNAQLTTNSTLMGNMQPVSNNENYYQVQQQYNMPTSAALNTATMTSFNNYFHQPQYYQQDPTFSLLDDDLLQSGPPPIQPEKIDTISTIPTTNCD